MAFNIEKGGKVAFNKLKAATWYDVLRVDGHLLVIRECNADVSRQTADTSMVAQYKAPAPMFAPRVVNPDVPGINPADIDAGELADFREYQRTRNKVL